MNVILVNPIFVLHEPTTITDWCEFSVSPQNWVVESIERILQTIINNDEANEIGNPF